jgi:ribosomal protein S27AE
MENDNLEFMFEGMPVGFFQESTFPSSDGIYHYMPYRGPGHYKMGLKLKESGEAQCSYEVDADRVVFTVRSCPEYGVLDLVKFERKAISPELREAWDRLRTIVRIGSADTVSRQACPTCGASLRIVFIPGHHAVLGIHCTSCFATIQINGDFPAPPWVATLGKQITTITT